MEISTLGTIRAAIGSYSFDSTTRRLYRDETEVLLPRKARELLSLLLADVNMLVPRERIFATVWPEGFVQESNLTQTVYLLRKSLAADSAVGIENVPGRGYRLRVAMRSRPPAAQPVSKIGLAAALLSGLIVFVVLLSSLHRVGPHELPTGAREDLALARYHLDRFVDLRLAETYFERAARDAPNASEGYAGEALIAAIDGYDSTSRGRYCAQGLSSLTHADAIGSSALGHTARAMLDVTCTKSLAQARRELDAALSLNPSDSTALALRARVALWGNRTREAVAFAQKAATTDPTSPEAVLALGVADYYAGDLRAATRAFQRLLEVMPDHPAAIRFLELNYEGLGEFGNAAKILRSAERDPRNARWVWAAYARLLALTGKRQESLTLLRRQAWGSDPESLAAAYAAVGYEQNAIRTLEVAQSRHALNTQVAWLDDFRFASLRRKFPALTLKFVTWR